jgi:hypothetical protein
MAQMVVRMEVVVALVRLAMLLAQNLLALFVLFGPVILVNSRLLAWGRHELVYSN